MKILLPNPVYRYFLCNTLYLSNLQATCKSEGLSGMSRSLAARHIFYETSKDLYLSTVTYFTPEGGVSLYCLRCVTLMGGLLVT